MAQCEGKKNSEVENILESSRPELFTTAKAKPQVSETR